MAHQTVTVMTLHPTLMRTALVVLLLTFSFLLGLVTRRIALATAAESAAIPSAAGHTLVYPSFALPSVHPLHLP